jgi:hypothetical protein
VPAVKPISPVTIPAYIRSTRVACFPPMIQSSAIDRASVDRLTSALQRRRFTIAPSGVRCKRLLGGPVIALSIGLPRASRTAVVT